MLGGGRVGGPRHGEDTATTWWNVGGSMKNSATVPPSGPVGTPFDEGGVQHAVGGAGLDLDELLALVGGRSGMVRSCPAGRAAASVS